MQKLAEADLNKLADKIGKAKNVVKEITMDLSSTYKKFSEDNFPGATIVADKFHLLLLMLRSVTPACAKPHH